MNAADARGARPQEGPLVERTVTVADAVGLHARPAAEFVRTAGRFSASVTVTKGSVSADARSILGLLRVGAKQGEQVTITAQGADAAAAVDALIDLVAGS